MGEKYGQCAKCGGWFPRSSLLGVNIRMYDAENRITHIPIRMCAKHWQDYKELAESMRWQNNLVDKP